MRASLALVVVCMAWVLTAPAWGGTVYVPLNTRTEDNSIHYETRLLVSNRGTVDRRFSTFGIPVNGDGTERSEDHSPPFFGGKAGGTIRMVTQDEERTSFLEIVSAPQLSFRAELVSVDSQGQDLHSAELPIITDLNIVPANETILLQGLERTLDGDITDFALVNMGEESATCEVTVWRNDGSQVAVSVALSRPPLSLGVFTDALGILQESVAFRARLQVGCDQPFYAFAVRYNTATGGVSVINPSASGASTLLAPGSEPP